jgi:hypothetical protein
MDDDGLLLMQLWDSMLPGKLLEAASDRVH